MRDASPPEGEDGAEGERRRTFGRPKTAAAPPHPPPRPEGRPPGKFDLCTRPQATPPSTLAH